MNAASIRTHLAQLRQNESVSRRSAIVRMNICTVFAVVTVDMNGTGAAMASTVVSGASDLSGKSNDEGND